MPILMLWGPACCLRTRRKMPPYRRNIGDDPPAAPFVAPDHPLPALLHQWVADHAAVGLPQTYLPKKEARIE